MNNKKKVMMKKKININLLRQEDRVFLNLMNINIHFLKKLFLKMKMMALILIKLKNMNSIILMIT